MQLISSRYTKYAPSFLVLGLVALAPLGTSYAGIFGNSGSKSLASAIRNSIDQGVSAASRLPRRGLEAASGRIKARVQGIRETARKLKPQEVEYATREAGEIIPGTRKPLNPTDARALAFRERYGLVPQNPQVRIGANDALPSRAVVRGQTEAISHTRLALGESSWISRNGTDFATRVGSKQGRAIRQLRTDYAELPPGQWSQPIQLANGSRIRIQNSGSNQMIVQDLASKTSSTYKIGNPGAWVDPQVTRHMTLSELKKLSNASGASLRTQGFTRSSLGGSMDLPRPVYTGEYRPDVVGSTRIFGVD